MRTLQVDLGDRSYPIFIGSGLLAAAEIIESAVIGSQGLVVTNGVVGPLYLEKLLSSLNIGQLDSLTLPDGEEYKSLATLNSIFDCLLEKKHNRKTTLIALGGGVIGDMTGFAAACYQRGVKFIQIPTTLLAQVDSSVGGKTGVNHRLGKNMIGAFHQPSAVIIDVDTLATLPDRELSAGIAEVIKYGLIADPDFFDWLEKNMDGLLTRDPDLLVYAIERSCRNKARVVAQDEREQGLRAILNFGHTFGHAIETFQNYTGMHHGEAVGVGMHMATVMSGTLGWLKTDDVERTRELISRAKLPLYPPHGMSVDKFLELMAVDKKAVDGRIRLVLLKSVGEAIVTSDYSYEALEQTTRSFTTINA